MTPPKLSGPSLPPLSGAAPRQIVLLLHGYGSNGDDMISLAPMWRQALPDALFLAPNGPERCAGAPGGYQWFGLYSLARDALSSGVRRAAPVLDAYVDEILASTGLAEENLLLVGFSQGTMMALHVGPLRPRPVAGIVGYSGVLADPHLAGAASKPPVLLIHGADDSVVPIAGHRQTDRELRRLGFDVESVVAPGLDHGVDEAGVRRGLEFAKRVLG